MNPDTGLRERKKEATRRALHEAAVRIAVGQGLESLTVEAIADAATVSRRTFSNYFASKEEALLYSDQIRVRRLLDLVAARPPSEAPWTALAAAAQELVSGAEPDSGWLAEIRLLRSHPSLLGQQVATYAAAERALTAMIEARTPPAPDVALRSRLLAATFLTTLRVTTHHWLDHPDASMSEVVRDALSLVGERWG